MIYRILSISILSFIISYILTYILIKYLSRKMIFDMPNDRSSHKIPTPRGGGLAILTSISIYSLFANYYQISTVFEPHILLCLGILGSVSFVDDIRSLPSHIRFIAQIIAVIIFLSNLPYDKLLFKGYFDITIDRAICFLSILWFINLYNFMDGIDGITSIETIHIFICSIILNITDNICYTYDHIVIIFAILGFLKWNWQPAKIFLGDIGSITLGFLSAVILFNIAINKSFILALVIPIYYLADSGITIITRFFKGKKILKAHNEHFYQKSVKFGRTHSDTVLLIVLLNIFICFMSIIYFSYNIVSLILSILATISLLYILQYRPYR